MSDNNRTSFLELDDAPVKVTPNTSVFAPVASLQPKDGATAKQDANGNWVNAIGLQSTASHRHVAKVWQDKCSPLTDFIETVKEQSKTKFDYVKPESEVRLKDSETLTNGMGLTKSGLNCLRSFTDIPSSMISFLEEKGYHEAMEMIANSLPSLTDALASHISNDGDDIFGNVLLPDYMKSEPDSDYGVGIAFRNSEIKNSTFKVSPFLFRAICLNGMIWGRENSNIQINQKHLGNIDRIELQAQVTKAVRVALTQGNDLLTLLGHSKQVKVESPLQVIAQLARDNGMTIEQGRAWHKGYLESLTETNGHLHDRSAFGIVNGLTRSAQRYSGATRESMETTASLILAPAIDASLQSISKRWGRIADNASTLKDKVVQQYAYIG